MNLEPHPDKACPAASMTISRNSLVTGAVLVVCAVACALALREFNQENSLYWFFARRVLEGSGGLAQLGRSPLYQLLLVPFQTLPYPTSIIVEQLVRGGLCLAAFHHLVRRAFGPGAGLALAVLWAPGLLIIAPAPQSIAMALTCLGVASRLPDGQGRRYPSRSYLFFILAAFFRVNYLVLFIPFLMWDGWQWWRQGRSGLRWRAFWPVLPLAVLFLVLRAGIIDHRWNNYQMTDMTWLPGFFRSDSSLTTQMMIASTMFYTAEKAPDQIPEPWDIYTFYETNFDGATSVPGLIRANPGLVAGAVVRNLRGALASGTGYTELGQYLYGSNPFTGMVSKPHFLVGGLLGFGVLVLVVPILRRRPSPEILLLVLGMILVSGPAVLVSSGFLRYFYGFALIYACIAGWWASRAFASRRPLAIVGAWCLLVLLAPPDGWRGIIRSLAGWEGPAFSNASEYRRLEEQVAGCKGLMVGTPGVFAAFTHIPEDKFYSLYEIPPFGLPGETAYDGLRPDRIDCIYVDQRVLELSQPSHLRQRDLGWRYRKYLLPYMKRLVDEGGRMVMIDDSTLVMAAGVPLPKGGAGGR